MKFIPLTQGKRAIVDDEDCEMLSKFKWHAHKQLYMYYAERRETVCFYGETEKKKSMCLGMHREILGRKWVFVNSKGYTIDHINGNGLDNRKCNLRICFTGTNVQRGRICKNNTSGYKGVSKDRTSWRSQAYFNYKKISLGSFGTPREAALAYNKFIDEHYDRYAFRNKV